MSDEVNLPESMIERQLNRIQEHLFSDYTTDNESYQGTLKPEVQKIIFDNLKFNEPLDEEAFMVILSTIVKELVDWVESTLDGINEKLLRRFMLDFVHQFVSNNLTLAPVSTPFSAHDFSYV
jgi:hypothetical protein